MQGPQRDDRVPGLDLLRALAIVWVMLFHSFLVGGLGEDFGWLSRFGWIGVDIFFVLSGYLIGTQLLTPLARGEPLRFGRFYARRAWRILPAFGVVLALYVAFPDLREVPALTDWWRFATFTLNLSYDYTHYAAFSHAWSLCVEEHFYLVFPLLASWLARRPGAVRVVGVCIATVTLGIALRWSVWLHDAALAPQRNWYIEDIYYPTWMRLDGLLCGVMLATLRVYAPLRWTQWQRYAMPMLAAGLCLVALALWLFRDRTGLLSNAIGWPLLSFGIGGVVFAAADRGNWLGRLRVPGAAWIAAVSYSLYLSHKLAFHVVSVWLAPSLTGERALTFAAYALGVLLFGAVLHYGVERPFLRLRKRRAKDGRAIPAFAGMTN
jgi:peptidoglycan/LPS O-acetylase OafA/YrhL